LRHLCDRRRRNEAREDRRQACGRFSDAHRLLLRSVGLSQAQRPPAAIGFP
jgi:hypothetical protein